MTLKLYHIRISDSECSGYMYGGKTQCGNVGTHKASECMASDLT